MVKRIDKALPYMVQRDSYPIKSNAKWLRETFKPLLAKRLPTILYGGFKHGFIVNFIQKHKKEYPYFVKVDIEKFYPGLSHHHLTVETQLAYKMLLGLAYVPKGFKKEFLPATQAFFNDLPLADQGIPLNSALSKAIAPLIYVPFFLGLKKRDSVKFVAFIDDILILCKTKRESQEVYGELFNFLKTVELQPNIGKVKSGRFSNSSLNFCGYCFAGGYVSIDVAKINAFKDRIASAGCRAVHDKAVVCTPRPFIKRINRLVSGFGHYYKCGIVRNIFEKLDSYIRDQVRCWFRAVGRIKPANKQLENLGLFSLIALYQKKRQAIIPLKKYEHTLDQTAKSRTTQNAHTDTLFAYLEKITNQNKMIIASLQKIEQALTR